MMPLLLSRLRQLLPPDRAFMVLGTLSLLAMLLLTPPFMFADEPNHFKRAWGIAQGELLPVIENGAPGTLAPPSIAASVRAYFPPAAPGALTFDYTRQQMQQPLDSAHSHFTALRPDALYPPLAYLPQALAIAVGRLFDVGPIGLLLLARLANLVAAVALVVAAIRIMPLARETMLLVALLPMSQALLPSASPDALTIAGGLLFFATVLRCLHDRRWSAGRLALIAATGVLMCATKYVYLPLLITGVAVVLTPAGRRWQVAGVQVAVAIAAGLAAIGWLAANRALDGDVRAGTDAAHQLLVFVHNPTGFVVLMMRSLVHDAGFLVQSTIGVLGWTNLHLPKWEYAALVLAFPLSIAASRDTPSPLPRLALLWFALLIGATLFLIYLGLFLVWTRLDSAFIEGVVGRYFLPFLPLAGYCVAALAMPWRRWRNPDLCYALLLLVILISSIATLLRVIDFWRLF